MKLFQRGEAIKGLLRYQEQSGAEVRGYAKQNDPLHLLQICAHLVKNVDFVVGKVERDHTAQSSESSLLHPVDVAALQVEVCEVRRVRERSPGELLQVVVPQVQFHRYLQCRGASLKKQQNPQEIFYKQLLSKGPERS